MSQSNQIWNDPRITAYALGELSGDELATFEQELASNPELAAAIQEARSLTSQLQEHFARETVPKLDANRRESILANPTKATLAKTSWFKRHWVSLVVAASLIGVLCGLNLPAVQMASMAPTSNHDRLAMEWQQESVSTNSREQELREESESLRYQTPADSFAPSAESAPYSGVYNLEPLDPTASTASKPDDGSGVPAVALEAQTGVMANEQKSLFAREKAEGPGSESSRRSRAGMDTDMDMGMGSGMDMSAQDEYGVGGMMGGGLGGGVVDGAAVETKDAGKTSNFFAATPEEPLQRGLHRTAVLADQETDFVMPLAPVLSKSPYGDAIDEGRGPGIPGDQFDPISDNAFQRVSEHPLSTFSADVDTASYSKVRDFLMRANQLPRPDAVRIEELVNYFDYDYAPPASSSEHPFATRTEIVSCPWNPSHRLARIAVKGKVVEREERAACNLVFLLDTSGSMDAPNKLPLVIEGMQMLLNQLGEKDRVAIVVYAGSAGLVLDSTSASETREIRRALTQLAAGGSTNGGAGISLAYQTARDHFIQDGVNRVILCTDGDFNVGNTGTDSLVRMVENEAKAGVFLTVLGFGMGNHNDAMLEQISGRGNGNYAFIDTPIEAKKVLVEQTNGTLVTIAKDVKFQVEFNPAVVSAYRLIGYENRVLAKEDFNDDKKDAGEIGAGHTVTALYELVPTDVHVDAIAPEVDPLKYQRVLEPTAAATKDETLTVKLRYKAPTGDKSTLVEFPVKDSGQDFSAADEDVRFAVAVAGFGMKLRRSEYAGSWTLADVQAVAEKAIGHDKFGLRAEFLQLVRKAAALSGQERSR